MRTVCIMCPVGCDLKVVKVKDDVVVTGNSCARGLAFGKAEFLKPMRMVTALIKTSRGVLPAKTSAMVPKDMISAVMRQIDSIFVQTAKSGDIVLRDVCGLGVNIVVTGDYDKN